MAKLILVRHGKTEWCKQKRIQGALDIPLNFEGQEEACKVAGELSKLNIHAIYSSSASCCLSTAHEIAAQCKIKIKKTNELNELNYGIWQGLLEKDVKKRYRKQYSAWRASPTSTHPPNGESIREAYDRAVSAMHKIIDKHKDANVCIVSHDVVFSLIKCYLNNSDTEKIWSSVPGKGFCEVFDI